MDGSCSGYTARQHAIKLVLTFGECVAMAANLAVLLLARSEPALETVGELLRISRG
jgi:hypothetical protein